MMMLKNITDNISNPHLNRLHTVAFHYLKCLQTSTAIVTCTTEKTCCFCQRWWV